MSTRTTSDELAHQIAEILNGHADDAVIGRVLDVVADGVAAAAADVLVDQTALHGMTVEEGAATLDLRPPRELVIAWVQAAKGMLGEAENYSETRIDFPGVSMEVGAAHEERYVLTVQRAGKVTPHQARQAAERERDALRAQRGAVLALHQPEPITLHGGRVVQMCSHCNTGDPYCNVSDQWPCPTVTALGGGS